MLPKFFGSSGSKRYFTSKYVLRKVWVSGKISNIYIYFNNIVALSIKSSYNFF